MIRNEPLAAIIPARGGSKGVPKKNLYRIDGETLVERQTAGTPEAIGRSLFTDYLLPFEVTSLLILIALMGAVVFAKKEL